MQRSIWKGSISFGLIQIPVALYPAESPQELSFHMLDKNDLSPIHFQRVNAHTGKAIDFKRIIKGYKTKDGNFVVLTDADFRRANVEATQTVDIIDFVQLSEIDPLYFDKPYYLGPVAMRKGKTADSKAYTLLRETLRRTGKAGIAKVVIRTREHLAALMPIGNVLVLNLLRFGYEVRDPSSIDVPSEKKVTGITAPEIKMAEQLVSELSSKWDPKKYKDEYREDLLALIRKKERAGEAHVVDDSEPAAPSPRSSEAVDMLSLLKKSLAGAGRTRKSKAANTNADKGTKKTASAPKRKTAAHKTSKRAA